MKSEQIVYLDDIAKTHSITQTAQRFFISQQALSFSLTKLEEEFGVAFLKRTNRGAELTEAGMLFLEKTRPFLEVYRELKNDFYLSSATTDGQNSEPEGRLTILCHTRVLEPLLVNLLEQYTNKYPDVTITSFEKENIDIIESIAQQQGDLGIVFVPEFLLDGNTDYVFPANIQIKKLFSNEFILCCNRNYPLKNKQSVKMNDLLDVSVVIFDTNVYMISPKDVPVPAGRLHQFYSNNTAFHKAMIRHGLATSVITAFEFRKLYFKHKDLTAIPISDSPKSIICLVTRKDEQPSQAAQLFIRMLEKYDFYGM